MAKEIAAQFLLDKSRDKRWRVLRRRKLPLFRRYTNYAVGNSGGEFIDDFFITKIGWVFFAVSIAGSFTFDILKFPAVEYLCIEVDFQIGEN